MNRQLRAVALSPFLRQRLAMFIAKQRASDLERLTELIESGEVPPSVDRSYPLPSCGRHPLPRGGRGARKGRHHRLSERQADQVTRVVPCLPLLVGSIMKLLTSRSTREGGAVSHYKSNIRDIEFNLFEVLGRDEVLGQGPFAEVDVDTASSILSEVDRIAREELAESFRTPTATRRSSTRPPAPRRCPSRSRRATSRGWTPSAGAGHRWRSSAAPRPPSTINWAIGEFVLGANPALWMYGAGPMFARRVYRNGNERDKKIAQLMVDQRLGRDDGAHRARRGLRRRRGPHQGAPATTTAPGTSTASSASSPRASSDLADNIVHLVLARPQGVEGAGGPGTKGLSLFIVPKFHFDVETGELGERNGAYVTNVEKKMGIKVSTTCEVTFGDRVSAAASRRGLPARRGARRHRADVPGHRERPHDGRHQGHRDAVDRLPQRARLREGARAGCRPDAGVRQDRAAGHDHPPPRRTTLADDAEGVRRGHARAGALHRLVAGQGHDRRARRREGRARRARSTTCCCRS